MPRITAPTVAEHRAAQQRALLDAAREVLAEGTPEIPGFAEVAARAGLARSSMYQYFKSRQHLLDALIEDSFPRWSTRVEREMAAAGSADRRVLAYVRVNLDLVAEGEHAIASAISSIAPSEKVGAAGAEMHARLAAPLVTALAELGVPDAAETADLVNAIVHAATRQIEAGSDATGVQSRAAALVEPYVAFIAGRAVPGNITP
ncbi:TetR/AcrR family transcriptional regulator [Rhodococcus sp. NPDC058532]|uniref:TetR/AcrR family transcriptional regulator n=1 Tax=Rhodococcus sp. NPDC058532 TaxID=3346540 RepID=UPI003646A52D